MPESLEMSVVLPATPEEVFEAWLDADEHSAFTGSDAESNPTVGGRFTAWDGYIWGTNLELDPNRRIFQSWRTLDFPSDAPDSYVEVVLEDAAGVTLLTLRHTNIPDGQAESYEEGWTDYYFEPLKEYFGADEEEL